MAKKSLFSTRDLYNMADKIVEMYTKFDLILKFAKGENNQVMIDAYSGIVWELELLINAYGLKEMTKIN
jgi:hypothetical protein